MHWTMTDVLALDADTYNLLVEMLDEEARNRDSG